MKDATVKGMFPALSRGSTRTDLEQAKPGERTDPFLRADVVGKEQDWRSSNPLHLLG